MFGQGASSTVESQVTDIAILGAGAVGQLICHQLHSAGLAVGLIARETSASTSEATDGQDLVFCPLPSTDADTDSVSYRVPTFSLDSTSLQQIRLLIVCVKAYQVIDAISPLLDILSPKCHILLLHNGMGPHLALA
ncbi:MAG: 2-dehydropantoate 2-reductase, partial [Shewanella sp.]